MTEVYEEGKAAIAEGRSQGTSLMTSLIRATTQPPPNASKSRSQNIDMEHHWLTESEIYGNMFVFNFAGHDTTAHTLAFAVVLLASNAPVQDWLHQELQYFLGARSLEDYEYGQLFPKLKRCLAVLVRCGQ